MSLHLALSVFYGSLKLALLALVLSKLGLETVKIQTMSTCDRILHIVIVSICELLTAGIVLLWFGRFGFWELISVLLMCVLILRYVRSRTRQPSAESSERPEFPRWSVILLSVGLAIPIMHGFKLSVLPLLSRDAASYHLPMSLQWIQRASMFACDVRNWFYPGGAELVNAVTMFALGEHVAKLLDLAYLIAAAVCTYRILCLFLHVDRLTAILTVTLIVTTPLLTGRLGQIGNDLFLLTGFLFALYLLTYVMTHDHPFLSEGLFAVSLALLPATKPFGIFYALILVIMAISFAPAPPWRSMTLGQLLLVCFIVTILSASFYFRNWIITGSPIYPYVLSNAGLALDPVGASHIVASAEPITRNFLTSSSILMTPNRMLAICLAFLALVRQAWVAVILCAFALVRFSQRRYRSSKFMPEKKRLLMLIVLLVCVSFVFGLTPLSAENFPHTLNQISSGESLRFGLPALILSMILAVAILHTLPETKILISILLSSNIIVQFLDVGLASMILCASLGLVFFLLYRAYETQGALADARRFVGKEWCRLSSSHTRGPILAVFFTLALFILLFAIESQRAQRDIIYRADSRMQIVKYLQSQGRPLTLAVDIGAPNFSSLYGDRRENRVVALGRSVPTESWMELIRRIRCDFVVLFRESDDKHSPSFDAFPSQDAKLATDSCHFRLAYCDRFVHAYRWEP